jgi:NADH-quinone oxidoreductase subunit J
LVTDKILLISLVLAALWTIMTRSLLRAGIGLALTSVILSIVMFRLNTPLAAVFELSVCAGLISVLFVSTISLTQPRSPEQIKSENLERLTRFWLLPYLVVGAGIILSFLPLKLNLVLPPVEIEKSVRTVMWDVRQMDLLGQIMVLLAGAFGVVIFFKETGKR